MTKPVIILSYGHSHLSAMSNRDDIDIYLLDHDYDKTDPDIKQHLHEVEGFPCLVSRIDVTAARSVHGTASLLKTLTIADDGESAPEKAPLYEVLASAILSYRNCLKSGNMEWAHKWREHFDGLVKNHMPSGSGFDNGTKLDLYRSDDDRLVFETAFHHMDEQGGYIEWTEHTVTVKPSLAFGFNITSVTGHNRRMVKDIISECFHQSLCQLVQKYPGV